MSTRNPNKPTYITSIIAFQYYLLESTNLTIQTRELKGSAHISFSRLGVKDSTKSKRSSWGTATASWEA